MAMYGGARDNAFKRLVARSFMQRTVSEEVIYYKFSLENTPVNVYGESKKKMYLSPMLLVCTVDRNPQTNSNEMYGQDTDRLINFSFLKDDLIDINLVPEKGDFITWNESYYEVDNVVEDQLLVGKDPSYSLESGLEQFGSSWSITCETHLTNLNRLNIVQAR